MGKSPEHRVVGITGAPGPRITLTPAPRGQSLVPLASPGVPGEGVRRVARDHTPELDRTYSREEPHARPTAVRFSASAIAVRPADRVRGGSLVTPHRRTSDRRRRPPRHAERRRRPADRRPSDIPDRLYDAAAPGRQDASRAGRAGGAARRRGQLPPHRGDRRAVGRRRARSRAALPRRRGAARDVLPRRPARGQRHRRQGRPRRPARGDAPADRRPLQGPPGPRRVEGRGRAGMGQGPGERRRPRLPGDQGGGPEPPGLDRAGAARHGRERCGRTTRRTTSPAATSTRSATRRARTRCGRTRRSAWSATTPAPCAR